VLVSARDEAKAKAAAKKLAKAGLGLENKHSTLFFGMSAC
jgi:hypothetical protein